MPEIAISPSDRRALAREILAKGGVIRLIARGRSMAPFIMDGDAALVEAVDPHSLTVGAIALYGSHDRDPMAHRVVRAATSSEGGPPFIVARGDGARSEEEHVPLDRVIGRVVALERNGKNRRVDRGRLWLAGRIMVRSRLWGLALVAPRMFVRSMAGLPLTWLQGFSLYSRVASGLLGKRISVRVGAREDSSTATGYTIIATIGGKIVASLELRRSLGPGPASSDWRIANLTVRVLFRRAGVAARMVGLAVDRAAREGAEGLSVILEGPERDSQGFWSKAGFEEIHLNGDSRWVIMSRPMSVSPPQPCDTRRDEGHERS